ncbi:unnamed protein product [Diatraea saccharalis]|uniref:Uncharacterized protein n=1 Tax=Diatraea saccharalis TaxID=40085 RepID=A0A9N9R539_9NEOP|nr:unnamed protein product [Diatraea saccharalis]
MRDGSRPGPSGAQSSHGFENEEGSIPEDSSFEELASLRSLLHFPEEVALRLTDTEYQLFYQTRGRWSPWVECARTAMGHLPFPHQPDRSVAIARSGVGRAVLIVTRDGGRCRHFAFAETELPYLHGAETSAPTSCYLESEGAP